ERERQRLESLRKKQEAEEQRKQKVEEEKRRRQAEMKQKREERLKKALQARERVEQMEEEKKKRMEQKILQSDEKVRVREEKVVEEKSKKKLSKKAEETGAQKHKALRMVREDESEQQELLQKRREDEGKEKGKRVLELKNLVEQRQVEQGKERYKQSEQNCKGGPGSQQTPQLGGLSGASLISMLWHQPADLFIGSAGGKGEGILECRLLGFNHGQCRVRTEKSCCLAQCWVQGNLKEEPVLCLQEGVGNCHMMAAHPERPACLGHPQRRRFRPPLSENNYGMDLNSDDSTDDEDDPRKPVPSWADGSQLNQAILHQYYHPVNVDQIFGLIASPKLEDIFGKSKPRYFKRTSSAVWHSPP
ncbi:INCE protein, partial [Nothocercus nigrocapillus]|nr:INCE protein [Nothocercus nigrocapillus]